MANSTEKNILLFLSEEDARNMIDALLNAYTAADVYARGMALQFKQKCEELDGAKKKLEAAEARLVVMDAAYADLDDERAAWKEKYDREVAGINKKYEQEGN